MKSRLLYIKDRVYFKMYGNTTMISKRTGICVVCQKICLSNCYHKNLNNGKNEMWCCLCCRCEEQSKVCLLCSLRDKK